MKTEKEMRTLSLLMVLALAGAIFVPVVSAGNSGTEQTDKTFVTLDYAEKVAQLHRE